MNALLRKEMCLSASVLTYFFLASAFMTLLPGYPILCGAFFLTLGIFHSFQNAREANDIVYSALLPIAKHDVVKGKFLFSVIIEMCGFLIMTAVTILRMTVLSDAQPYRQNALMNANPFFLGMALVIFGIFNLIFIGGFFRTGYKLTPFVWHIIAVFLTIGAAETLHHIPGLECVNAFGTEHFGLQLLLLAGGALLYVILTCVSYRTACANFEKIDL